MVNFHSSYIQLDNLRLVRDAEILVQTFGSLLELGDQQHYFVEARGCGLFKEVYSLRIFLYSMVIWSKDD